MKKSTSKIVKIVLMIFGVGIVCIALVLAFAINAAFEPNREEVLRVRSPSGDMDAVVIEVNGGATTAFAYEVMLEDAHSGKKTAKVAYLYDPWRNVKGVRGLNPKWASVDELHIEFFASRTEEVISPIHGFLTRPVRIVLRPGIDDLGATPLLK